METFNTIQSVITQRRSTKPAAFNGALIPDDQIRQLLELGNWAPTHGLTEPWRFQVYTGAAIREFCRQHAELYKQQTPPEKFNPSKYEKQLHNGDQTSHLIVAYMQRGDNPNIAPIEEICATAAAVQNMLLGAQTLGISALWSTGGLTLHPALKHHLGLDDEDNMIGLLYLGYTDEPVKPSRRTPIETKVKWFS